MYFSPFCQIPLKKFVLSVQQFSKSDTQSISWKRLIFIQFQKAYLCTNIPLACAIARKHHTLTSVLPIFVFVAVLDVSCFPKDKIQLEASWFDQLTSKLFCFTMIIIPSPPLPGYMSSPYDPTQNPLWSCISPGLIAGILRYLTFVSLLHYNGWLRKFSLL